MKSASTSTLPEEPPNGVTCGIDWARDDHAVSVVDARGREVTGARVEHSAAGLRELVRRAGRAPASARSRSNAPTARSSMRCSRPGSPSW